MSNFNDLLNSPLPSKANAEVPVQESAEDMDDVLGMSGAEEDCNSDESKCEDGPEETDVNTDDVSDIEDSDDDFDPDGMSDEELAALDAQLSGDAVDAVAGSDDSDEEKLSPEEEIEADDMMSVAATTLLVNDELNAEEKAAFAESETDARIAINEGFMTEADVNEIAMESGLVTEAKYTNKMIIRLDAESKKKQLYALAVNVSAAAHHDPDYIKLKKVMKMRKILRAKLDRKYHGEATKRMRIYFARLKKSKSAPLSKIGDKYSK